MEYYIKLDEENYLPISIACDGKSQKGSQHQLRTKNVLGPTRLDRELKKGSSPILEVREKALEEKDAKSL